MGSTNKEFFTMKHRRCLILLFVICPFVKTLSQNYGAWVTADSMQTKKYDHAAIQLDNGNILVTGGFTSEDGIASRQSEVFDVKTRKWGSFSPMNKGRAIHSLIKLLDGSILAIGGFGELTCEILDQNYSVWKYTDSIKTKRFYGQCITLMQDGNVLLTGGTCFILAVNRDTVWKECEMYTPAKNEWSAVKDLNIERCYHTATLLKDGRILVIGGYNPKQGSLNSCESYDPQTKEWNFTAPMKYPRSKHSATLLSNGKVVVIGGGEKTSELYDPIKNEWTPLGLVNLATGHNLAVTLKNEEYLFLIHDVDGNNVNSGWELFSLKDFISLYHQNFQRPIQNGIVAKINDYSLLFAGGSLIMRNGELSFTIVNQADIYSLDVTDIKKEPAAIPENYSLAQNYPNPFNPGTTIKYSIPVQAPGISRTSFQYVTLKIYDSLGREVATPVNGEKAPGNYEVTFNASYLPSGVYFYTLTTSQQVIITKKMLFVK
jgi:hypothetical protein